MSLRSKLTPVLPGTCPTCGVAHAPEDPHRLKSLFFKYSFFDEHGRNPTQEDAMAHCSEAVKEFYREGMKKQCNLTWNGFAKPTRRRSKKRA